MLVGGGRQGGCFFSGKVFVAVHRQQWIPAYDMRGQGARELSLMRFYTGDLHFGL